MLVSTFNQNYSSKIKTYPSYYGYNKSAGTLNKGVTGDVFVKSVSFNGKLEDEFIKKVEDHYSSDKSLLKIITNPDFKVNTRYISPGSLGLYPLVDLAISYNRMPAFKAFMERPEFDPNGGDVAWTPLHQAVLKHRTEYIKELLKHPKINIFLTDGGRTPLDIARQEEDIRGNKGYFLKTLQLFIECFENDPNKNEQKTQTLETLKKMFKKENDLNEFFEEIKEKEESRGRQPDESKLLKIVKDPKFNINDRKNINLSWNTGYRENLTPLLATTRRHLTNIVSSLLEHPEIDPNVTDEHGDTSLLFAVEHNYSDIVEALLKHPKIDISITNEYGKTALDIAKEKYGIYSESGRSKCLKIITLLENHQNGTNYSEMAQKGNIDLKHLKEIISPLNGKANKILDDQGRSPLHALAETDTPDTARLKEVLELIGLCVEKGVDINAQDNLVNETALFGAYRKKNRAVAEFLLSKGANPDIQNVSGDTVFHYACFEGDEEMLKLILKYNPDLEIKNNQDKTGLDYAKEKGNTNVVNLINKYAEFKMLFGK